MGWTGGTRRGSVLVIFLFVLALALTVRGEAFISPFPGAVRGQGQHLGPDAASIQPGLLLLGTVKESIAVGGHTLELQLFLILKAKR